MILSEVIEQINIKAGFRRDVPKATMALTLAINHLENDRFLPWFLLSEYEHTLTCTNESRIPLPDRFLKGYEEGELYYLDDEGIPQLLYKADLDDAEAEYQGASPGAPVHYAQTGKYFRIFPRPDKAYTLRMIYYKKSRTAWADPDNINIWLDEAPRLVIACAAIILMEDTRDIKGIQIQDAVREVERSNLLARNVERHEINLSRQRSTN